MAENLEKRNNFVLYHPMESETDFEATLNELKELYPEFQVPEKVYNKHRVRWLREKNHYEFYLERVAVKS